MTLYRIPATVVRCEERKLLKESHKDASGETVNTYESLGWWLTLNIGGVHFSFSLGEEKPSFTSGQQVRLTLEPQ